MRAVVSKKENVVYLKFSSDERERALILFKDAIDAHTLRGEKPAEDYLALLNEFDKEKEQYTFMFRKEGWSVALYILEEMSAYFRNEGAKEEEKKIDALCSYILQRGVSAGNTLR